MLHELFGHSSNSEPSSPHFYQFSHSALWFSPLLSSVFLVATLLGWYELCVLLRMSSPMQFAWFLVITCWFLLCSLQICLRIGWDLPFPSRPTAALLRYCSIQDRLRAFDCIQVPCFSWGSVHFGLTCSYFCFRGRPFLSACALILYWVILSKSSTAHYNRDVIIFTPELVSYILSSLLSLNTTTVQMKANEVPNPWWDALNVTGKEERITFPALMWAGWFDIFLVSDECEGFKFSSMIIRAFVKLLWLTGDFNEGSSKLR